MEQIALSLIALGLLFLAGLAADRIGDRTRLPRVTLLLGCGLIAGQSGYDLIPDTVTQLYPLVSIIALTMVAFLLGSSLSLRAMVQHGRAILVISLCIVIATLAIVALGLWAMGLPLAAALVLGALATATDPAATFDVIRQSRTDSAFTRTLKGIVAIDDAWGLIVFSLIIVLATGLEGSTGGAGVLSLAVKEIAGSVALGLAIGLPAALLTGRLSDGEPLRIEALGLVFLTAGLALLLDLSYLITGMTVGTVIVNLARHHTKAFHEIESVQWPFLVIFFILAGATLDAEALRALGWFGAGYILLRGLGRVVGGLWGGAIAQVPANQRLWYGPALLPQAGVAIGMALIAADHLPEYGDMIMALTIGATVVFELVGPIAAARAIARVNPPPDA
ncbi:cation:proton antiporter [Seohaeicola saemankumensis]|nr:cation:proton antiporter [Seohaeicola saemankumensis]MCA0872148.1 cation:proton antiporter [Seohaeicola saemankumensis]